MTVLIALLFPTLLIGYGVTVCAWQKRHPRHTPLSRYERTR